MKSTILQSATASIGLTVPTTPATTPMQGVWRDEISDRIYEALLAAANARPTDFGPEEIGKLSFFSTTTPVVSELSMKETIDTSATTEAPVGYLTYSLTSLPSLLPILLPIIVLFLSLFLIGFGAQSLFWFSHIGTDRGGEEGNTTLLEKVLPGAWGVIGQKERKRGWLRGGIGGIVIGFFTFGYLSSFLTLLVLSHRAAPASKALPPAAFLAILITSSVLGGILAGRWKVAMKICLGLSAGISFSCILLSMFDPASLMPRLVLWLIMTIFTLFAALFPIPKYLPKLVNWVQPFLTSLVGSWGFGISVALMIGRTGAGREKVGLADMAGMLVTKSGVSAQAVGGSEQTQDLLHTGTPVSKGLIVSICIILVLGTVIQHYLTSKGTDEEEAWDKYLEELITTRRDDNRRKSGGNVDHGTSEGSAKGGRVKGTFEPYQGFWSRLFRSRREDKFTSVPRKGRHHLWSSLGREEEGMEIEQKNRQSEWDDEETEFDSDSTCQDSDVTVSGQKVKKQGSPRPDSPFAIPGKRSDEKKEQKKSKGPVQYGDIKRIISNEFEQNEIDKITREFSPTPTSPPGSPLRFLPKLDNGMRTKSVASRMSGDTLIEQQTKLTSKPEFPYARSPISSNASENQSDVPVHTNDETGKIQISSARTEQSEHQQLNAVPATPSLIKAIDRINLAKHQARAAGAFSPIAESVNDKDGFPFPSVRPSADSPRSPQRIRKSDPEAPRPREDLIPKRSTSQRSRGQSWDEFWTQVVEKSKN